jgi:hypothetical protein
MEYEIGSSCLLKKGGAEHVKTGSGLNPEWIATWGLSSI